MNLLTLFSYDGYLYVLCQPKKWETNEAKDLKGLLIRLRPSTNLYLPLSCSWVLKHSIQWFAHSLCTRVILSLQVRTNWQPSYKAQLQKQANILNRSDEICQDCCLVALCMCMSRSQWDIQRSTQLWPIWERQTTSISAAQFGESMVWISQRCIWCPRSNTLTSHNDFAIPTYR